MILDYSELRNGEHQPRFHGNGFIQLDLEDGSRLNVWDPSLYGLAQSIRTGIHDHRFSFISEVIYGVQVHQPYEVVSGDEYEIYTPVRRGDTEDTKLVRSMAGRFSFVANHRLEIPRGNSYEFMFGLFHDTVPIGLTATLMGKTKVEKLWTPRVACRVGEKPDNGFNRDLVDKADLWSSIENVLDLINN